MNPIKSIKLTLRRRVSIDLYRLTNKVDIILNQLIDCYWIIEWFSDINFYRITTPGNEVSQNTVGRFRKLYTGVIFCNWFIFTANRLRFAYISSCNFAYWCQQTVNSCSPYLAYLVFTDWITLKFVSQSSKSKFNFTPHWSFQSFHTERQSVSFFVLHNHCQYRSQETGTEKNVTLKGYPCGLTRLM